MPMFARRWHLYDMPSKTTTTKPTTLSVLIVAIAGAIGWLVVAVVALTATELRPALDDYCRASRGQDGVLNSVVHGYEVWAGDLFQMSLVELLVGQPLVHLPLEVASAIPFLLTALSVSSVALFLVFRATQGTKRNTLLALFTGSSLILTLWWAFWWVPTLAEKDANGTTALLASATTHWQNVNIAYVLVPMVLIGAWTLLHTHESWSRRVRLTGFALVGFLSGTGGMQFAVSAIGFAIVLWITSSWLTSRFIRKRVLETTVFIVATCMGMSIVLLSPGAALRGDLLAETRPLQYVSPGAVFAWVFPQGVFEWFSAFFHAGSIVVLIASMGLAVVFALLRIEVSATRLLCAASCLFGFSFIISLATRAADAFSYTAFWHEAMPRAIVFVALVLAGTAAGVWLLSRTNRVTSLLVVAAVLVAGAASVGSILEMRSEISSRSVAWQSGPAPLPGLPDIELDWIGACWNDWSADRHLPAREG